MDLPILTIIDAFNLIDRVEGIIAGLFNAKGGGMVELRVSRHGSFSGYDCSRLLDKYHVPTHGRRVTSDHFIFVVRRQQAEWAEYILLRAGVPVDGKPINTKNATYAQNKPGAPPAWVDNPQPKYSAKRRRAKQTKRENGILDWLEDLLP